MKYFGAPKGSGFMDGKRGLMAPLFSGIFDVSTVFQLSSGLSSPDDAITLVNFPSSLCIYSNHWRRRKEWGWGVGAANKPHLCSFALFFLFFFFLSPFSGLSSGE